MANAALAQLVQWGAPRGRQPRGKGVKSSAKDAARRRERALAALRHYDTFTAVQAGELLDAARSAARDTLRAWHKVGIIKQVTAGAGGRAGVWEVVK